MGTGFTEYLGDGKMGNWGDDFITYKGGSGVTDFLGFDDGSRDKPESVPEVATKNDYDTDELREFGTQFNTHYSVDTISILPEISVGPEFKS